MSGTTEKIAREHGVSWISGSTKSETIGCQCGARTETLGDEEMMSSHARHVAEVTEAAVRAEATVTPSREDVQDLLTDRLFRKSPYLNSDQNDANRSTLWAEMGNAADAILTLLPGRSEAEVKAEAELIAEAKELVESWDRAGSWTADSPIGLVDRLARALEGRRVVLIERGSE